MDWFIVLRIFCILYFIAMAVLGMVFLSKKISTNAKLIPPVRALLTIALIVGPMFVGILPYVVAGSVAAAIIQTNMQEERKRKGK